MIETILYETGAVFAGLEVNYLDGRSPAAEGHQELAAMIAWCRRRTNSPIRFHPATLLNSACQL